MSYIEETNDHIERVKMWVFAAVDDLLRRAELHDQSKLQEPERSGFEQMSAELKLSELKYGSEEYRAVLRKYKDSTIGHHYANNDHHPEHHAGGISDMTLMSLVEMLCDWKAAGERMKDGDMAASLAINGDRFGIEPQLMSVLVNTATELGMLRS